MEKVKILYEELRREEEVLKQEEGSLKDSDAAKLKQQEIELTDKKEGAEREAAEKRKQEGEKEERYREIEGKQKKQKQDNELLWEEITAHLAEMEEALGDIPFDDFAFLKKELMEEPEKEQAFQSHSKLLGEYVKRVEKGKEVLFEEKTVRRAMTESCRRWTACGENRSRGKENCASMKPCSRRQRTNGSRDSINGRRSISSCI